MKSELVRNLDKRREAPLTTPTDLGHRATTDIAAAMNAILADVFAIYVKTKNFHWHMSGPHFRDYHLLLDEQADQILGMTDAIAENPQDRWPHHPVHRGDRASETRSRQR
jgi:starvation-inducible DNA-binding protein